MNKLRVMDKFQNKINFDFKTNQLIGILPIIYILIQRKKEEQ